MSREKLNLNLEQKYRNSFKYNEKRYVNYGKPGLPTFYKNEELYIS